MSLVIDLDVLLAKLGFGEPFLTERAGERGAAGDDVLGDDRIASADAKRRTQFGLVFVPGRLDARQLDRREAILFARLGRENDMEHFADVLSPRLNDGVIIALAAKQLRQEIRVGA